MPGVRTPSQVPSDHLNDYVSVVPGNCVFQKTGSLYNIAAYFTSIKPVTFQIWRQDDTVTETKRLKVVGEYTVTPSAAGYNWDLYHPSNISDKGLPVQRGDWCGFTFSTDNQAEGQYPLGTKAGNYDNYLAGFSSRPPQLGEFYTFDLISSGKLFGFRAVLSYLSTVHSVSDIYLECSFDVCPTSNGADCRGSFCEGVYSGTVPDNPAISVWKSQWLEKKDWYISLPDENAPTPGCFINPEVSFFGSLTADSTSQQDPSYVGRACLLATVAESQEPLFIGTRGSRFYFPTMPEGTYELKFAFHLSGDSDAAGNLVVALNYVNASMPSRGDLDYVLFSQSGKDARYFNPPWSRKAIEFWAQSPFRLVFQSQTKTTWKSSLALDDIHLRSLQPISSSPLSQIRRIETSSLPYTNELSTNSEEIVDDAAFSSSPSQGWTVESVDNLEPGIGPINSLERNSPTHALFFFPPTNLVQNPGNVAASHTSFTGWNADSVWEGDLRSRCSCVRISFLWYAVTEDIENFWVGIRGQDQPSFDYLSSVRGARGSSNKWKQEVVYAEVNPFQRFQIQVVGQVRKTLNDGPKRSFAAVTHLRVTDFCSTYCGTVAQAVDDIEDVATQGWKTRAPVLVTEPKITEEEELAWYWIVIIFGTVFILAVILVITVVIYRKKRQYDDVIRERRTSNMMNQAALLGSTAGMFGSTMNAAVIGGSTMSMTTPIPRGMGGSTMSMVSALPYQSLMQTMPPGVSPGAFGASAVTAQSTYSPNPAIPLGGNIGGATGVLGVQQVVNSGGSPTEASKSKPITVPSTGIDSALKESRQNSDQPDGHKPQADKNSEKPAANIKDGAEPPTHLTPNKGSLVNEKSKYGDEASQSSTRSPSTATNKGASSQKKKSDKATKKKSSKKKSTTND